MRPSSMHKNGARVMTPAEPAAAMNIGLGTSYQKSKDQAQKQRLNEQLQQQVLERERRKK